MNDELLKALNVKIKYIDDNIEALNKINNNLKKEHEKLDYVISILNVFKDDDEKYNIYHFPEISKADFEKILNNDLPPYLMNKFSSNSCNYDGLNYLISGINNGVNLSLTNDQIRAVEELITYLDDTRLNYLATIDGIKMAKDRLEISNLEQLEELKKQYLNIVDKINDNKYIVEVEDILSALNFARYDNNKIIDILSYLLVYNSDIYISNRDLDYVVEEEYDLPKFTNIKTTDIVDNSIIDPSVVNKTMVDVSKAMPEIKEKEEPIKPDIHVEVSKETNVSNTKVETPPIVLEPPRKENIHHNLNINELLNYDEDEDDIEFSVPNISVDNKYHAAINENTSVDDVNKKETNKVETELKPVSESVNKVEVDEPPVKTPEVLPINDDIVLPDVDSYSVEPNVEQYEVPQENSHEYQEDATFDAPNFEADSSLQTNSNVTTDDVMVIAPSFGTEEVIVNSPKVEEDFDLPLSDDDVTVQETEIDNFIASEGLVTNVVEDTPSVSEPVVETVVPNETPVANKLDYADVKALLDEYHVNLDSQNLVNGDLNNYREVLNLLREKEIINYFNKNSSLMSNVLLYSDIKAINEVLGIVKHDLSIDNSDYRDTLLLTIDTLPSIFIREPNGNFETFIANINSFKKWNIDLINLYDFSRELLIVDHNLIMRNYDNLSLYNLKLNEKNAKYYLGLPNLEEKLDYYVEAVYKDTSKEGNNKTFDGIDFIRDYPSKINNVCNLTIKRLRYSSQKGLKLFSKDNKLTSEITNLKVDSIIIPENELDQYFNNEFEELTEQEFSSYEKFVRETPNVSLLKDKLLSKYEKYHHKNRYIIENINISYNKVLRIYNALIKNGVDNTKAIIYAFCYNLVITKDEYRKLRDFLKNRGGL